MKQNQRQDLGLLLFLRCFVSDPKSNNIGGVSQAQFFVHLY